MSTEVVVVPDDDVTLQDSVTKALSRYLSKGFRVVDASTAIACHPFVSDAGRNMGRLQVRCVTTVVLTKD